MNYVFCGSYLALFFVLHLKDLGKEVTVITYNQELREFCLNAGIEHIYFEFIQLTSIITFYQIVTLKRRLDNLIKRIKFNNKEDSFYLLARAVSCDAFYLGKELAKEGTVYFKNPDRDLKIYGGKFSRVFLEMLAIKYLFKIFLGLDLVFYETNTTPRFGINDKFLEKNNIKKITPDPDYHQLILNVAKKSKIYQKGHHGLLVDTDPGMVEMVELNSVRNLYKNLSDLPVEFAIKKHPNPKKVRYWIDEISEEFLGKCEKVPDYLPVELVFNSINKFVISVASVALIIASQMEPLKAISLLELIDWYHQSYKTEVRNYLEESSNNRIIFVNDFEELRKLLLSQDNA